MQDIIKKYKKHKISSHLGIIVISFIVAFGVNFLLIDGTEIGQNIKASVLNIDNISGPKSDIFFEKENDIVLLKNSKSMKNVKSISFSMIFNPENLSITNLLSKNNQITNIGDENGIKSIIINLDESRNINENENILEFNIEKKDNKTEHLNIVNANFTDDSGEVYMFSTSGISF